MAERSRGLNKGSFYNVDCMKFLQDFDGKVELTLTDIPYDGVNRSEKVRVGTPLRKIGKGKADIITFNLTEFLEKIFEITTGTIIIFCGYTQISEIYDFFMKKQEGGYGTPRILVWHKTNPSPMNGEYIYLQATEIAVCFRKHGATFNAKCKHNVFEFPIGKSVIHPTEKNHELLADLIKDCTQEGDTVFDACAGSGSTLLVAYQLNRKFIGCELDVNYYNKAKERLDAEMSQMSIFDFI